jgi:hypothetical protein
MPANFLKPSAQLLIGRKNTILPEPAARTAHAPFLRFIRQKMQLVAFRGFRRDAYV